MDRPSRSSRKSAARINGDFLGWLDSLGDGRPFFAFLNFYDAHHPYLTPEPEDEPGPESGPGHDACGPPPAYSDDDVRMLREWWEFDKRGLDARRVDLIRDSYERCITYLDAHIGRLLDELDRRGVLKNTLVIVTADHGEHLGERKLFGHGTSLYNQEVHVPLLVIAPGGKGAGRVVRSPVSLRDLAATVMDVVGLSNASPFPGQSLAQAWTGSVDADLGPALSEVQTPPVFDPNLGASPVQRGPMTSLVGWGYHYIRNGDGREELYALDDPAEEHDLASKPEAAETLARLRSAPRR
ncbi:MAG: sulfatase-like hydrolase/transferase [Isosphaeraceae bacterium]